MSEAKAKYFQRNLAQITAGDANAVQVSPQAHNAAGGEYIWDAVWTGAGSMTLTALAADNVTIRTVATLAAPGTFATPIKVGEGTTLFIRADGSTATGVSFSLRQTL